MSKVSIIAAIADNYAIGKQNQLPWHLPADLKHFKILTTGHAVIMGKRTFESLPNGPLPNRKNIVLRSILSDGVTEGYFEAVSLEDALELTEKEKEVFIIGGSTVYKECLEKVDYMYITWVHADFDADVFFPRIDFTQWEEVSRNEYKADEKNPYDYSFVEYKRIS